MPLMPFLNSWPWARDATSEDVSLDSDHMAETDSTGDESLEMIGDDVGWIDDADEHALIQAARDGDEDAFARLVDIHRNNVVRLAYRMVHDTDEANDIAQDVFLAAWRGLISFRGDARLGTWLYAITYHRCLRSIEAQRNRIAAISQFASMQMERLANTWGAMQANLAEQNWRQAIQDQIDRLPVKYRMVLLLRHLNDLSYEEIAQTLTIPLSNVKTHLFRARAMLRERLQELEAARDANLAALGERWQALTGDVECGMFLRGHLKPASNS